MATPTRAQNTPTNGVYGEVVFLWVMSLYLHVVALALGPPNGLIRP